MAIESNIHPHCGLEEPSQIALEFEPVLSIEHFQTGLVQILELICDQIMESEEGMNGKDSECSKANS